MESKEKRKETITEQALEATGEAIKSLNGHNFAFDLLKQMKEDNLEIRKTFKTIIITLALLWFVTIGGFVWFLYQYDYTSTTTYQATGIYSIIDSNGNVIAKDISDKELAAFEEWITKHGNSEEDSNEEKN